MYRVVAQSKRESWPYDRYMIDRSTDQSQPAFKRVHKHM